MSITTDAPVATTLPEAADKPAKRTPAKAPAKKAAPAAKKAAAKPAVEKVMYEATGRSGQTVYRQSATPWHFAVDVADPKATKPLPKAGQIWKLFATKEAAEKWAAARQTEGYDCIVVEAKAVTK